MPNQIAFPHNKPLETLRKSTLQKECILCFPLRDIHITLPTNSNGSTSNFSSYLPIISEFPIFIF